VVAVTVFSAPDDGRRDARNTWSDSAVNKCLHIVASSWTFLLTLNHDARNREFKIKKKKKCGLDRYRIVTRDVELLINPLAYTAGCETV